MKTLHKYIEEKLIINKNFEAAKEFDFDCQYDLPITGDEKKYLVDVWGNKTILVSGYVSDDPDNDLDDDVYSKLGNVELDRSKINLKPLEDVTVYWLNQGNGIRDLVMIYYDTKKLYMILFSPVDFSDDLHLNSEWKPLNDLDLQNILQHFNII